MSSRATLDKGVATMPCKADRAIRALLVLALLGFGTACSSFNVNPIIWRTPTERAKLGLTPAASTATPQSGKLAPVELSVAQAFFNEDALKIKVKLTPRTRLPANSVVVVVSGLREGQVVEEHHQLVSEMVATSVLEPKASIAMLFSLKADALTEYQIRCSWGEEAKAVVAKKSRQAAMRPEKQAPVASDNPANTQALNESIVDDPALAPDERVRASLDLPPQVTPQVASDLALEDVEIDQEESACASPPCDVLLTVHARLLNNSPATVQDARLAIGLYWSQAGKLPSIPKSGTPKTNNEEEVALKNLRIPPGGSRRVRVRIDRTVPVIPGGRFVPHLRVLPAS